MTKNDWTSEAGQKFDHDKPPMDLLDGYALEQVARVMGFGANKYGEHNWRGGIRYSRLIAAMLRHIHAFNKGEDFDPETGISHVAHAGCCVMFLLWMQAHRQDMDDRWKPHTATS